MQKIHNYFDFFIGTLVLFVAGFFFFSSFSKTHQLKNSENYFLFAKFSTADGINTGADVKIAGVKVGNVTKQELDVKTYQAIIHFELDKNVLIPADSSIKVASEGLLGSKYLAIAVGSDSEFLQPNQEISFTQSSVNFEELLGKFIFSNNNKTSNQNSPNEIK
jgi:phospholipid/cholesterol/gamma-HCH transport system substrate-binding protein